MKSQKLKVLTTIFLSTSMVLNTFSIHSFAYTINQTAVENQQVFSSKDLLGTSNTFTLNPTISSEINTKSEELIKVIVEFKTTPIAVANSTSKSKLSSANIEAQVIAEHSSFKDAINKSIAKSKSIDSIKGIPGSKNAVDSSSSKVTLQEEYYYAFNGIALTMPSNMVEDLAKLPEVNRIWKDREFKLPIENSKNTKTVTMESFPSIGVDRLHDEGLLGKGIKVGVLDTGIDYNHPDLKDVYKGGYDFVNNDNDPMETTYEDWKKTRYPEFSGSVSYYTSHGTHVSGTIAGTAKNPGNLKAIGVAPNVNLYVYKVLGPYGTGQSSWILSGIDKAVKDKMNVINLSLGATIDDPLYPTSIAINNAAQAGVIPVVAAGNSGPNDYTLGSPGTSPLAITVGASNTSTTIPIFTGSAIENNNINFKLFANNYDFDLNSLKNQSFEMVDCGIGNPEDFQDKDLTNKIALIQRGTLTFVEKIANAKKAGAKLVFLYNNVDDYIPTYLDTAVDFIPTFNLSKADGETLEKNINNNTNNMFTFKYISSEIQEGDKLADFSSRGPVNRSVDIKPDVVAPGVNIFSTYPAFINDKINGTDYSYAYNKISGTSMATPHVAGVVALMLENAKKDGKTLSVSDVKTILMNTSDKLNGDYSVYEEGAGRIDAYDAVKDSVELKVLNVSQSIQNNEIVDIDNITGSLLFGSVYKENKDINKQKIITLVNNSTENKKFKITVSHSTPKELILDSNNNGVKLNIPEVIEVPAGKTINVSTSLIIPQNAAKGFYEGTLIFTNQSNSAEDYRIPYAVRYVEKGIKNFNLTKNALCDDYSNKTLNFWPFTESIFSFNSPMVSAKLFLKNADTGKRVGYLREYDMSSASIDVQYQLNRVFNGYYQPMIGDYVQNKVLIAPEGHYKIELEAIDKDGNKYTAEDHLFVDNTPPVVTFDKEPGIYSISESDYTVEDGIKAFYIHGKIQDDTIDKLKALGYKTDGRGNPIYQNLNILQYSDYIPNKYSGYPTGSLMLDEDGNFKMGVLPEEIVNTPLEVRLFAYDYGTATINVDDQILFGFKKESTPYGTLTYDKTKVMQNDEITSHINVSNIQGVTKLNFTVDFLPKYFDIQSVEINADFKKLLDSKGVNSKLSYEISMDNRIRDNSCKISLELLGDTSSINISDLMSIIDIKAKNIAASSKWYYIKFRFLSNSDNNYVDKNGNTSTLYVIPYDNFKLYSKTTTIILNYTTAEGFFTDEGYSNYKLPYDKLGTKVYVVDSNGEKYDGTVSKSGQVVLEVPANLQDGMFYMEVPGHFKNWVTVSLGKSIDGIVKGINSSASILTSYAGDINDDGIINQTDLDLVTADLGKSSTDPYLITDLDKDGIVGVRDLKFVNKNMGMVNPRLVEDAEEAIATLKVSQDKKDIQNAIDMANLLPESPVKQDLLNSIKEIADPILLKEAIQTATKAVEKAEASKTQADVDAAMALVKALPDSDTKNSLLERLNKVQSSINATIAIENATKAVEKAEASLTQADVDTAMALVKALPDSDTKNSLAERLNKVQKVITATKAVEKADASLTQADYDAAIALVKALPDSDTKNGLTERLSKVEKVLNVIKAVEKAETSKAQIDIDAAMTLVNALPNSDTKNSLLERLNKVQSTIDVAKALENATKAVEKAEASLAQADVDATMALIKALPDSEAKNKLTERVNKVQATIKAIADATKAVENADKSKNKKDYDAAMDLVKALPNGAYKTELLNRLNKLSESLPQAGAPIGTGGILALGGLLSAAGVTLILRRKKSLNNQ